MKIPKFARRLKYRFFGTGVKPHAPSFAERELVDTLANWLESTSYSAGRRRKVASEQPPTSLEGVVTYFTRRDATAFFASADTLAALARQMATVHPEWRERLLAMVAADRTEGLKIYSMTGPPLRPDFPWGRLPTEPNSDDLYSIRPHRFAFAPRHALAILYGEESAEVFADVLEDWMRFAALGRSEMPYCSALVVIQRMLALSWARAFILALPHQNAPATLRLHAGILRILHADIRFLIPRLGKSTPNNHLLADRFASWYIRLLFPEFVAGSVDLDAHEAEWLAELDRQVYPDGTSFEHSLHYHEFACEMAAAYVLLCRRNSRPIPSATLQLVERMLAFQVGLAGPGCVTLPLGDAVEDPLFSLDPSEGWATAGLREIYRALFRPELNPSSSAIHSVERAFWLLGGSLEPRVASSAVAPEFGPQVWSDGGLAVLPDPSSSARLVFRTGPALHQRLFGGHMHADLLSVCVTYGDQAVLTDPGTWSYRWRSTDVGPGRAYFSGPAAHNGLIIDEVDPLGTVEGDFRNREIPVRVSTTRCLLGDVASWLEAEVRGSPPYAGHRRGVVHVSGMYWLIYDQLPAGAGTHAVSIGFQTGAGIEAMREGSGMVRLASSAGTLWLAAGPGLDWASIVNGGTVPAGGWIAPGYGELTPAPQLRYRIADDAGVTALTLGSGAAAKPVLIRGLRGGLIIEIEGRETSDRLLLATHDEAIRVHTTDGHGYAAALWLRSRRGQHEVVRCLGFREAECSETGTPRQRHAFDMQALLTIDNGGREIEFREPKDLSVSFSGETWS
jgi:hypothetical protein